MAVISSIHHLLAAASELNDIELAVTLQGLLSKRPATREVLLNVWRSEDFVAGRTERNIDLPAVTKPQSANASKGISEENCRYLFSPPERNYVGSGESVTLPSDEGPGITPDIEPLLCNEHANIAVAGTGGDEAMAASADQPSTQDNTIESKIRDLSRRFAAFGCGAEVGPEHVLAATIETFPSAAEQSFGRGLYVQLVELLDKSQLSVPPPEGPPGTNLPFEEDTEELLAKLPLGDPVETFRLFLTSNDPTAATQLIAMAKIFMEHASTLDS